MHLKCHKFATTVVCSWVTSNCKSLVTLTVILMLPTRLLTVQLVTKVHSSLLVLSYRQYSRNILQLLCNVWTRHLVLSTYSIPDIQTLILSETSVYILLYGNFVFYRQLYVGMCYIQLEHLGINETVKTRWQIHYSFEKSWSLQKSGNGEYVKECILES